MPLIQLGYNPKSVSEEFVGFFASELPVIVAEALNAPEDDGGGLTPDDIEVWCRKASPNDVGDADLQIVVLANHFASREANLEERKDNILNAVKDIVHLGLHGFVWVLLAPAAFGEF